MKIKKNMQMDIFYMYDQTKNGSRRLYGFTIKSPTITAYLALVSFMLMQPLFLLRNVTLNQNVHVGEGRIGICMYMSDPIST